MQQTSAAGRDGRLVSVASADLLAAISFIGDPAPLSQVADAALAALDPETHIAVPADVVMTITHSVLTLLASMTDSPTLAGEARTLDVAQRASETVPRLLAALRMTNGPAQTTQKPAVQEYTAREAAQRLGLAPTTIRSAIHAGRLHPRMLDDGSYLIAHDDLEHYRVTWQRPRQSGEARAKRKGLPHDDRRPKIVAPLSRS